MLPLNILSDLWNRCFFHPLKVLSHYSFSKYLLSSSHESLVAQMVKHLSTMQETWVRSLGQEDPVEKEMAIHSSTIAWKIPWTEEPGRLQSMGSQRVRHHWATSLHLTRRTFVGKVISLLLTMLSRLVITFLPRSKRLLISWLQSPFAVILEPPKIKSDSFNCFPIYFPWN